VTFDDKNCNNTKRRQDDGCSSTRERNELEDVMKIWEAPYLVSIAYEALVEDRGVLGMLWLASCYW